MEIKELGIDEAGRGPVLGPMILAGVVVPESKKRMLETEWKIQDSKLFGSTKKGKDHRAELAKRIQGEFDSDWIEVSTVEIDSAVKEKGLNRLEQKKAGELIQTLKADKVVLDGKNLFKPLERSGVKAENKADQNYVSVAAASILAKHIRDVKFLELCDPFIEEFEKTGQDQKRKFRGGGYANKATLEFVTWYYHRFHQLPSFYRFSYQWSALKEAL